MCHIDSVILQVSAHWASAHIYPSTSARALTVMPHAMALTQIDDASDTRLRACPCSRGLMMCTCKHSVNKDAQV